MSLVQVVALRHAAKETAKRWMAKQSKAVNFLVGGVGRDNKSLSVRIRAESLEEALEELKGKYGNKFSWSEQDPKMPKVKAGDKVIGIMRPNSKPLTKDEMKLIDRTLKL